MHRSVMWRLKGGVRTGKEFDTRLGARFFSREELEFRTKHRVPFLETHFSISPLDSADDSLLVASVEVRKSNNASSATFG